MVASEVNDGCRLEKHVISHICRGGSLTYEMPRKCASKNENHRHRWDDGSFVGCIRSSPNRTYLRRMKQSYGYGKIFLNENIYTFCGPKTDFHRVRYFITAFFVEGKVSLVYYTVNDPSADKMYTED